MRVIEADRKVVVSRNVRKIGDAQLVEILLVVMPALHRASGKAGSDLRRGPRHPNRDAALRKILFHGFRQRPVRLHLGKQTDIGVEHRHQFALMGIQEQVNVITVIIDGIQQSQQTALRPAKLHIKMQYDDFPFHALFQSLFS